MLTYVHLISASAILNFAFIPASVARTIEFSRKDEIENTVTYHVNILAEDYKDYTWENSLKLICEPSGFISINWYKVGAYSSSSVYDGTEINFKFDDDEIHKFSLRELHKPEMAKEFVRALMANNTLIMKEDYSNSSSRFSLDGTAFAFQKFARQCLQ